MIVSFKQFLEEKTSSGKLAKEHLPHVMTGMRVMHALTGQTESVDQFIQRGIEHFNNPTTSHKPFEIKSENYHVTLTHPSKKKIKDLVVKRMADNHEISVDLATGRGYKSFATEPFERYSRVLPEFSQQHPISTSKVGDRTRTTFGSGRQSISRRSTGATQEDWAKKMQINLDRIGGEDIVLTDTGHVASKKRNGFSVGNGGFISNLSDFITGIRLENRERRSGFHHFVSRGKLAKATPAIDFNKPESIISFFGNIKRH